MSTWDETLALDAGDPQLRLHAAWALGLRAQDRGAAAARRLLTTELATLIPHVVDAMDVLPWLESSDPRAQTVAIDFLFQSPAPETVHHLAQFALRASRQLRVRLWVCLADAGCSDVILCVLRAERAPAEVVLEATGLVIDSHTREFIDLAWIGGIGLEEELLRVSRRGSIPHAWLLARAPDSFASSPGIVATEALWTLAFLGHDGCRIEAGCERQLDSLLVSLESYGTDVELWDEEPLLGEQWLREGLEALKRTGAEVASAR